MPLLELICTLLSDRHEECDGTIAIFLILRILRRLVTLITIACRSSCRLAFGFHRELVEFRIDHLLAWDENGLLAQFCVQISQLVEVAGLAPSEVLLCQEERLFIDSLTPVMLQSVNCFQEVRHAYFAGRRLPEDHRDKLLSV